MENKIQIFENTEFGKIRTTEINGEPWFVGKDVAQALGYADTNKAIAMHVDEEDKLNDKTSLSLGQRGGWLINESGLYSLILSSKLPNAKKFKRWVTSEVLPSIRQTGGYGNLNLEEIIAKTAVAVAAEIAKQLPNSPAPQKKPTKKIAKSYKYSTPSKISTLPPEIKEQVDEMIISGRYSCQGIADFIINSTGMYISQVAVNRYKRNNFIDENQLVETQLTLF